MFARVHLEQSKQKGEWGGGGESDMVNVALLLMEFSQIELLVYRGLQRGKAGLPCLQTVVV